MWNIDKLIESLDSKGLLNKIIDKRLGMPRLPIQLYLRLVVASIATNKELSTNISTALESYTMKNEQKHFDELKLKAAAANMSMEDYLAEEVARRLTKND